MAGTIKVSTEQVIQIANDIEGLNRNLIDELNRCKTTIESLETTWTGEASQATIDTFNEFANQYFQVYYDVINQYVVFLRNNVAAGYEEVEAANISLAESFK